VLSLTRVRPGSVKTGVKMISFFFFWLTVISHIYSNYQVRSEEVSVPAGASSAVKAKSQSRPARGPVDCREFHPNRGVNAFTHTGQETDAGSVGLNRVITGNTLVCHPRLSPLGAVRHAAIPTKNSSGWGSNLSGVKMISV
jgi:hypothetical protein